MVVSCVIMYCSLRNVVYHYSLVFFCCVGIGRFKNRPKMTFEDAEAEADQTFTLHPDHSGQIEYLTK